MINPSEEPSKEKLGQEEEGVRIRTRWLFGILTLASFLMLQTLLTVGPQDIALKVSLWAFAVVLPMNVLLVLLAHTPHAKKALPDKVRSVCLSGPAGVGTFIGIDAAFWHASWVGGIVFTVTSMIAFAVAIYCYVLAPPRKDQSKEMKQV